MKHGESTPRDDVRDPVCGMAVDPRDGAARRDARGRAVLLLLGAAAGRSSRPSRRATSAGGRRPSRCRRARSTPARCTRRSSRTAPATARSAAWRWSRRGCRRRTRGRTRSSSTSAPLRGRRGADRAAAGDRHGADARAAGRGVDRRAGRALGGAGAGDAGRALVRLAVPGRGWRSFRTWRLNMFSLIALGVAAA